MTTPDVHAYNYYTPVDGSDDLLLVEKWPDTDALSAHVRQPYFADIARKVPKGTEDVYVRVDENKLYYVLKNGETGDLEGRFLYCKNEGAVE